MGTCNFYIKKKGTFFAIKNVPFIGAVNYTIKCNR